MTPAEVWAAAWPLVGALALVASIVIVTSHPTAGRRG